MIASLKRSSLTVSKHLGLYSLVAQSGWRRQRLLILCYHGISLRDEHEWNPGLYMSPAIFERRLALLRRTACRVLPLAEAVERLYRNDLPERAVALTFDDGYCDFRAQAWPLLRAYGFPATVYLTTARMDHNFPIVNLFLSYALWTARDRVLCGDGLPGLAGDYALDSALARQRVIAAFDAAVQRQGFTARDKDVTARAIIERLGLEYEQLRADRLLTIMSEQEARACAREGLDIQLHTHLHRTPEDPQAFVDDVLKNRERIEAVTGERARHLCYPSGVYRPAYLPALRHEGIVSATTCDPGMAGRGANPLLLPRFVDTSYVTELEFEAWITGMASCLPRRTTRASVPPAGGRLDMGRRVYG